MLNLRRYPGPISADGDVPYVPALGDTPCQGFGAKGSGYFAPGCGLVADIVRSLALSRPRGQKMPKMSTVAIAVSYQLFKLIDINENMSINVAHRSLLTGGWINLRAYRGRKEAVWDSFCCY